MLARQPSLRRFVVLQREYNLSYMTRWVSFMKSCAPVSHIPFLLGKQLEPSETDLMPSVKVSEWFIMDILSHCIQLSERLAWYWASNHIWWKQLYLPWLTRFWVWCKGGDGYCLGLHREAVYCNWAEGSVACNLVSLQYVLHLNN